MSGADAGMDGLDALMAELSANSAASAAAPQPAAPPTVKTTGGKERQRVSGKLSGGDKGHVVVGESWADEEISSPAEVQAFVRRLRTFQMRVADPATRAAINKKLAAQSFASTLDYYRGRAKLGEYTVMTELKRMEYEVTLPGGKVTRDAAEIRAAYQSAEKAGEKETLVWRMANQSVLAELVHEVQLECGRAEDAELSLTLHATRTIFQLDLTRAHLSARACLAVATVGGGGQDMQPLAEVEARVDVDTRRSEMRQEVTGVQLAMVFDEHLLASARSLAQGEASTRALAGDDVFGTAEGGLALREKLVSAAAIGSGLVSGVRGVAGAAGGVAGGVLSGLTSLSRVAARESTNPPKLYNR